MNQLISFFKSIDAILFTGNENLLLFYKTVGAIISALFVWAVLKFFITFFYKKINKSELIKIKDQTLNIIYKLSFYTLALLTFAYILRLFEAVLFEKILYAFFIMLFAAPIKEACIILLGHLKKNIVLKTKNKTDDIIFDLLNKFSGVIIYATSGILSLDILGVNIMPFVAGAGIAGLAISFAAKDTLSNIIAGILLLIDRPFEIGDRIELWSAPSGSASWGDVIDIGLRATKIKTTDNIIIIIPNNEIMKRDIVNYTIISSKIRVRVNIGVAYDTDLKKAKEIISKVAKRLPWVSKDMPIQVVVRNFGESSVDLQLRIWIDNARKRMDTISFVTDNIKEVFDKEGIEIPFPKRDITIINKKNVE